MMKSAVFVCVFVVLALATTGCSGETTATGTSSGSSGAGGGGGAGGGPSIVYPTCTPHQGVTILTGTLDGMPFDKTLPVNGSYVDYINTPKKVVINFEIDGGIDLVWTGMFDNGTRHPAAGTLLFPGESVKRAVKPGSTIEFSSNESFLMDLLLENGELIGCSNW